MARSRSTTPTPTYRSPLDPPKRRGPGKLFSRRVLLACAGTLGLGMLGGAALARLGTANAMTAATGDMGGAMRRPDPERIHVVSHGDLPRARREFLDPRELVNAEPLAEGAEPSIFDPPGHRPMQVVKPRLPSPETTEAPASTSGLEPSGPPAPTRGASVLDGGQPPRPLPKPIRHAQAWMDNGLPVADPGGRPMIAIVIDDLGLNRRATQDIIGLPGPLTLSHMAYAKDPAALVATGRAFGHETMLHLPMEPADSRHDPGPGALLARHSAGEIRTRMAAALDRFPGVVGMNNHMGSRFTAEAKGMGVVMEDMASRGLMFLDSRTTGRSVAPALARAHGVPFTERAVFIEHEDDPRAIQRQLALIERVASRHGHAVAIGHPRKFTHQALARWLPSLNARGFALVPASAIVKFA